MDRQTFSTLATSRGGPHVSIYAPMHVRGEEEWENRIRVKTRVREARDGLVAHGYAPELIDAVLGPGEALVREPPLWHRQSEGVAIFLADGFERQVPLTYAPPDVTYVGTSFRVRPLVPALADHGRYHLLVLDLGGVSLYRATESRLERIALPDDVPLSLEEAMRYDVHQPSLQHHGNPRASAGGRAAPQGGLHGSGGQTPDKKSDIEQWFHRLEPGVRAALRGEPELPVLVAGVGYLFPIYEAVDTTGRLLDDPLTGSGWTRDPDRLAAEAWQVAGPALEGPKIEAMLRYAELRDTERAVHGLDAVVKAAEAGRIDTLIVGMHDPRWGRIEDDGHSVVRATHEAPGFVDLLDLVTLDALESGAEVWVVPDAEVPDSAEAVAILRF